MGLDLVLLAGEPSGDLQGALLLEKLFAERPGLKIAAVAGPRMRQFPIECILPMEELQVMGFVDVVLALPRLARIFFALRTFVLQRNPKAVVGIDYPGMHLRLYKALRKRGFSGKLIHYICPTVWAWGKKRIRTMEETLDLLLAILPFEPACFQHTRLRTEYVGHPLVHAVRGTAKFAAGKWLALFPGSRPREVERNLPLMLKVAERLRNEDPELRVAVSGAAAPSWAVSVPREETHALMRSAHLALAKSGTVTLELALHGVPTVVQYAIGRLDTFLAQRVFRIRLPFYALPNIVAGKLIFPEFFGPYLTSDNVFRAARGLLFDKTKREDVIADCRTLVQRLGNTEAALIASRYILKIV